ncbi:MAG TPA: hypothetical protein VGI43_17240 [Mucilaginibacter sp.]|jgi:uncharacterized membrane protein YjfL (UPF0719 family)
MAKKKKNNSDSWFISFLKSLLPSGKPKWLSWVSILFSLWLILYPEPREPLFVAVLILPLFGLIINRFLFTNFESLLLIKVDSGKESFSIANFILFPGIALIIRCFAYDCASFLKVFEIGTIGFILLLAVIFAIYGFIKKDNTDKLGIYLFIIPAIALYSYSAIYVINCEFDNSKPLIFNTKAIGKYSTTGKNSGYYITVNGWKNHKDSVDVKVSSSKYYSLKIGQQIKVEYWNGLLAIPWYDYDLD